MQGSLIERLKKANIEHKMDNFDKIMRNNRVWAHEKIEEDVDYFERLVEIQTP